MLRSVFREVGTCTFNTQPNNNATIRYQVEGKQGKVHRNRNYIPCMLPGRSDFKSATTAVIRTECETEADYVLDGDDDF